MSRPADTMAVTARVPTSWVTEFELIAAKLSRPGLEVSRADGMRIALARGLQELRAELGLPPVDAAPASPATKKRANKPKP